MNFVIHWEDLEGAGGDGGGRGDRDGEHMSKALLMLVISTYFAKCAFNLYF